MRFVFLLRDTLGRAIPTRTPADMERIRFVVSEDGVEQDLNEVSMRVDPPDQLKVNLVLMLDYTGSLYQAGVGDVDNPRNPGEVLDEIRASAARFLDDLPPSYRVALMYHNDRQPKNRLIHPFSTNRESLKTALRDFTVPAHLHGTSDIWDAVQDAVNRIVAEDGEDTLPFDDADVRAVLFITDGNDNSSLEDANAAATIAKEAHVRLYPLAYSVGASINFPDLLTLADETGGHFYNAGNPENINTLLGGERALALESIQRLPDAPMNVLEFFVANSGKTPLAWSLNADEIAAYSWISSVTPSNGDLTVGAKTKVVIELNPLMITAPQGGARAALSITSSDGAGEVHIAADLDDAGQNIASSTVSLRDDPGLVWGELQNQVVLTYVTPGQRAGVYSIRAHYQQPEGGEITGFFEEDGLFYLGDVRAGQISMYTTGLTVNAAAADVGDVARAEVYVRADYVPRGVNSFRMRFIPMLGEDAPPEVAAALAQFSMKIELAPEGLMVFEEGGNPNWRLISEGDGVYRMLTPVQYVLPYASFGNLLRVTLSNLLPFVEAADAAGLEPEFFLDMRVDNDIYFKPATPGKPSETLYFHYPSGILNPERPLRLSEDSDLAGPARYLYDLATVYIDPDTFGIWDRDADGLPDFLDSFPDEDSLPGRLTRPSELIFNVGEQTLAVEINNNRLDTFSWNAYVQTSETGRLQPEHFELTFPGMQQRTLAPGQSAVLQVRFVPGALQAGNYFANLVLVTDAFGIQTTPIKVQL